MSKHETLKNSAKNSNGGQRGANAVPHTKTCLVVAYTRSQMPSITTNMLTGSEIKGNYANCGKFSVSHWIQGGWLENKAKLKSRI